MEVTEITSTEIGRTSSNDKRGGLTSFHMMAGSLMFHSFVLWGLAYNLIVFLIREFNIGSITAALTHYAILCCCDWVPIVIAILTDSLLDSFSVIGVYSLLSLLGMILLLLTSTIQSLKPPSCELSSHLCETPSKFQYGILFLALVLATSGTWGAYNAIFRMGARQFDKPESIKICFDLCAWFSWVGIVMNLCIINPIEYHIDWGLGFGIFAIASAISLVMFLGGKRFYLQSKLEGGLFTTIARVVVAGIRNRKISPSDDQDLNDRDTTQVEVSGPKSSREEDISSLKNLIKIIPVWCPDIFFETSLNVFYILTILQALTLEEKDLPPGTYPLFSVMVFVFSRLFIDGLLVLMKWDDNITARNWILPRIGIGYIFNIMAMVASSLVESRRLHVVRTHQLTNKLGPVVPMSNMWLLIPQAISGFGLGFHNPMDATLYCQELSRSPTSYNSMVYPCDFNLLLGMIGNLLSGLIICLLFLFTGWLPNNINGGRLDYVFSMLALLGIVSFGYFLFSTIRYKYQSVEKHSGDEETIDQ